VTGKTNKPSLHDMAILSSIGSTQLFCACQDRSSLSPELLLQQLGPAFAKKNAFKFLEMISPADELEKTKV
jgi:hypothetical protein